MDRRGVEGQEQRRRERGRDQRVAFRLAAFGGLA